MMEHCKGCKRYMKSCSGMSERTCNKHKLRIPYTNADRIRAMSDEEMAEFLLDSGSGFLNGHALPYMNFSAWLEWLREEVSE